ncbi:hypothetical protein DICSQDRAFT_136683 [Dichomitus squalens LYAD-421 SS1]|uniref:Uncharacterized protein n=2 Tax=Dichomitus squalens TaxID=114155 RepID=A0A4Q9PCJ1_9APHY|nr:uncharacterized protein DICSQDRAFT_136683 [Dichomitus squalens LYAD-421 SS1]EJF61480.1 hypothetical protein DICSQDRAFT_136683 [Dichomitus squalens LYAD-421 SS1]TBU52479.1 hypothetical protein BD310DRAFT_940194 [Dichomitus squalens]
MAPRHGKAVCWIARDGSKDTFDGLSPVAVDGVRRPPDASKDDNGMAEAVVRRALPGSSDDAVNRAGDEEDRKCNVKSVR